MLRLGTETLLVGTSSKDASAANWGILLESSRRPLDSQRLNELLSVSVNWSTLIALAEEHGLLPQLAAIVFANDPQLVPPEVREKIRGWNRQHAIFALSLIAELFRLLDRFANANIEVLATKGPALAQRCYGDPSLRQYHDVDLIVRTKDIRRSTEIMAALGYEPRIPVIAIAGQKTPGEYVFRRPDTNLLVEFHTEHTFRYHPRRLQLDDVFARKTNVKLDGRDVPVLSLEDELVLICIHSAKHCWEQLSWVADVAALVSGNADADWNRAVAVAKEVEAERMLHLGLRLASVMLGLHLPAEIADAVRSDKGAVRLAEQIANRMPLADASQLGVLRRAIFRLRMRPGFFKGPAYLLRLSLSPTEDDWPTNAEEKRPWLLDALRRPFRLIRKYGQPTRN